MSARTARLAKLERFLHELLIGSADLSLRDEDRKKARELDGLLVELGRAVGRSSAGRKLSIVDAAAGRGYVGLALARFVLAPEQKAEIVAIERNPAYRDAVLEAAAPLAPHVRFELKSGDLADPTLWPWMPDLVVALHACGPASDAVIDCSIAVGAKRILLVPCCTSEALAAAELARNLAAALGMPHQAEVRRRFIQSIVDAERTLRLEAAGYEVEVVSFVPPTVTPHHLLWRARRVGEPRRMQDASVRLARLRAFPAC